MPHWWPIMEASQTWGVPPWTWAGGSPLLWFLRYRTAYAERARAQQAKARAVRHG